MVFGGCGVQGGEPQVFNDTYVLHITDGYRWEKLAPSANTPSPRWRHTATLLPDNDSVLVFGGLCRGKRFNDAHVFSLQSQEWRPAEIAGAPPHPRSHHTANLVEYDEEEDGEAEKKVFIIGGYGAPLHTAPGALLNTAAAYCSDRSPQQRRCILHLPLFPTSQ